MNRNRVQTSEDALAYLLDCNLATVDDFCMKKNIVKSAYERAIEIAQINLDWCVIFNSDVSKTRGKELVENNWSVAQYATNEREKFFPA